MQSNIGNQGTNDIDKILSRNGEKWVMNGPALCVRALAYFTGGSKSFHRHWSSIWPPRGASSLCHNLKVYSLKRGVISVLMSTVWSRGEVWGHHKCCGYEVAGAERWLMKWKRREFCLWESSAGFYWKSYTGCSRWNDVMTCNIESQIVYQLGDCWL